MFKQEDIGTAASIVKPNSCLSSVDLKDGFHHIRIRVEDQGCLSFECEGHYYTYVVLPFGFCLHLHFFAKSSDQ